MRVTGEVGSFLGTKEVNNSLNGLTATTLFRGMHFRMGIMGRNGASLLEGQARVQKALVDYEDFESHCEW